MLGVAPALRMARTDLKTLMNESGRSDERRPRHREIDGRDDGRRSGARVDAGRRRGVAGSEFRETAKHQSQDSRPTDACSSSLRPNPQRRAAATRRWPGRAACSIACAPCPASPTWRRRRAFPLRGTLDGSLLLQFNGEPFDPARPRGARMRLVTPGFFEAMGVPLDKGRDFSADDRREHGTGGDRQREFVRRHLGRPRSDDDPFAWRISEYRTRNDTSRLSASSATSATARLPRIRSRVSTCRRGSFRSLARP